MPAPHRTIGTETIEIDGVECVVIHLALDDNHRYFSACTRSQFKLPDENDKRPRTLCEACRLLIVKG